jgi:hypothetical protein
MTANFSVFDKGSLKRGTGAIICLADSLSAFDKKNLIIPSWFI